MSSSKPKDPSTDTDAAGSSKAKTVPSSPEGAIPGTDRIIDDSTQYIEFFEEKNLGLEAKLGQPKFSFPISSRSREAETFYNVLPKIKSYLKTQKFAWECINCLGRSTYGTDEPIVSTIIITGPKASEELVVDAAETSQREWKLPIEFVIGSIESLSFFGFKEKNDPIVSGSSCGNYQYTSSGTLGGFITLKGDPSNSIYAVSNHHVFQPSDDSVEDVCWRDVMKQNDHDLADTDNPTDDYKLNRYLRDIRLAKSFQPMETIFSQLKGSIRHNHYRRYAPETEIHVLEGTTPISPETLFLKYDEFCNGIAQHQLSEHLEGFMRLNGNLKRALEKKKNHPAAFEYLMDNLEDLTTGLDQRLVAAKKKQSFFIEHPSRRDRQTLVTRLKTELRESREAMGMPNLRTETKGVCNDFEECTMKEIKAAAVEDIGELANNLTAATQIRDDPKDHIIAAVWVSSGKNKTKLDPYRGKWIKSDWAIAKLLPGVTPQNSVSVNILRPNLITAEGEHQMFRGVRDWRKPETFDRLRVFKRGRTTGYTMGHVNGVLAEVNPDIDPKSKPRSEYTITPAGPTGKFTENGDSGSWIMDKQGLLVGMIWGKMGGDIATSFTPAHLLFKFIGKKIRKDLGVEDTQSDLYNPRVYFSTANTPYTPDASPSPEDKGKQVLI